MESMIRTEVVEEEIMPVALHELALVCNDTL
jgi:hypothetical protein